jgi:Ras-related protein Rab-8A
MANTNEHIYKLLMVGDSGAGKTALFLRFCEDCMCSSRAHLPATIGVDFRTRSVNIDGCTIKLQIWDSAGAERLRSITTCYYRDATGIMVVYDVTRQSSFDNVERCTPSYSCNTCWSRQIADFASPDAVVMLIGTKCDLPLRAVSTEQGAALAAQYGWMFAEVNSADAIGGALVRQAFTDLVSRIKTEREQMGPADVGDHGAAHELVKGVSCTTTEREQTQPADVGDHGTAHELGVSRIKTEREQTQPADVGDHGTAHELVKDVSCTTTEREQTRPADVGDYGTAHELGVSHIKTEREQTQPADVGDHGTAHELGVSHIKTEREQTRPADVGDHGTAHELVKGAHSAGPALVLATASACGDAETVARLLVANVDPNTSFALSRGDTALHRAAANGHNNVVRLLVHAGANPHAQNAAGKTPFDIAPSSACKAMRVAAKWVEQRNLAAAHYRCAFSIQKMDGFDAGNATIL